MKKGKRKNTKKIICVLFAVVLLGVIFWGIYYNGSNSYYQEPDISTMREADALNEENPDVTLAILNDDINENTSVLTLSLENYGNEAIEHKCEIIIDYKTSGSWYFFGRVGNALEAAYGAEAGETEELEFKLDSKEFGDGDYIETWDGTLMEAGGNNHTSIKFAQGEYRIRLSIQDENGVESEVVLEFSVE